MPVFHYFKKIHSAPLSLTFFLRATLLDSPSTTALRKASCSLFAVSCLLPTFSPIYCLLFSIYEKETSRPIIFSQNSNFYLSFVDNPSRGGKILTKYNRIV